MATHAEEAEARSSSVLAGLEADAASAREGVTDAHRAFETAVTTGEGIPAASKKVKASSEALAGAEELLSAGRVAHENAAAALEVERRSFSIRDLEAQIRKAVAAAEETEGRLAVTLRQLEDDLNRLAGLRSRAEVSAETLRERFGRQASASIRNPLTWPLKDELRAKVDRARFGPDGRVPDVRENVAVSVRIFENYLGASNGRD